MEEQTTQKTSKYNSGVAQIMRLDDLWKKTHTAVIMSNFYKWNVLLDRIWCELAKDIDNGDYKTKKYNYDEIDEKIGTIKDTQEGFKNPSEKDIEKRNGQFKILMEKELFLRRLENSLGKGTAWEDEDEDAWE